MTIDTTIKAIAAPASAGGDSVQVGDDLCAPSLSGVLGAGTMIRSTSRTAVATT
jgi:hypothetical protein